MLLIFFSPSYSVKTTCTRSGVTILSVCFAASCGVVFSSDHRVGVPIINAVTPNTSNSFFMEASWWNSLQFHRFVFRCWSRNLFARVVQRLHDNRCTFNGRDTQLLGTRLGVFGHQGGSVHFPAAQIQDQIIHRCFLP